MKHVALLTCLLCAPAFGQTVLYEIEFSSETSGTSSPGVGVGLVTIDLDLSTMRVEAEFSGLTGTVNAAHIHCCTVDPFVGNAGVASPVPSFPGFPSGVTAGAYDMTFDMTLASSYNAAFVTANGGTTGDAFAALLDAFDDGRSYLNIHTSTFGGGEIRGYLQRVPEPGCAVLATLLSAAFVAGGRRRR